jgi:hypothetical protein
MNPGMLPQERNWVEKHDWARNFKHAWKVG